MPEKYLKNLDAKGIKHHEETDLLKVSGELDVIYVTRIQKERFEDLKEYEKAKASYRIDKSLAKNIKPDAIILHPLPRVDEIDAELDDLPQSVYFKQAHNGIPVRMALLGILLGKNKMTLAITNAQVMINGTLQKRNILIEDRMIVELTEKKVNSGETINASGKIILPGLIDCHVHLREPGMTHKEDFRSGSMAAVAGGVTTVFDMPNTLPQTTSIADLEEKRELAVKSIVNYGLYVGATGHNSRQIAEAKNVPGIKLYMGSSTGNMLLTDREAIAKVFKTGKRVVVHAEDELIIRKNAKKFKKEKSPEVHAKIRNGGTETSAVRQAVEIAGGSMTHLTHLSTGESLQIAGSLSNVQLRRDAAPPFYEPRRT